MLTRCTFFAAIAACGLGALTLRAEDPAPPLNQAIQNPQPKFFVHAEFVGGREDYYAGDSLGIRVQSEVDAYLYVMYQQADGKVFLIFPNRAQPQNRVKAKETVRVPGNDDRFRWVLGAPFGKERVKVVASREPLKGLSNPELRAQMFNQVKPETLKGATVELHQANTKDYAEVDLQLNTHPADAPRPSEAPRRVGVFFGVSQYQFNEQAIEFERDLKVENPKGMNLKACAPDARDFSKQMRESGGLDELKVFVDGDVTKRNMQQAITEWLPANTKPGDTVFIYFAGHGTQVEDDSNEEADGMDELLLPHDFVDLGIMLEMLKYVKAHPGTQLPAQVQPLLEIARQHSEPKQANAALMRETGITDDLFARWVQQLNGRKVIVVLDACSSGGFATMEKGAPRGFDFLGGELARLKGIGEENQAILAACRAKESALELKGHGLLTHFLLISLDIGGPVKLEDVRDFCEAGFPQIYDALNAALRASGKPEHELQHVLLVNHCEGVVLLKK